VTPVKANAASGVRPPALLRGPIDATVTATIEGFRRILGTSIYGEILWRIGRARESNQIPNAQLQSDIVDAMERAAEYMLSPKRSETANSSKSSKIFGSSR
jgi:hypothetical protein